MVKVKGKEQKCRTNPKNPLPPCPDGYIQKKNKYDDDCCYVDFQSKKSQKKEKVDKSSRTRPNSNSNSNSNTNSNADSNSESASNNSSTKPSTSKPNTNITGSNAFIDFKHTKPAHNVSPETWALINQTQFPNWITKTFIDYKKKNTNTDEVSCEMKMERMSLFPHQRFIRDYLQFKSPYRGLLVYHGLGVGKSCSSIAAAEMLMNYKKVVIMLPASLRSNYINEIIKCGNKYYDKKIHHWKFVKKLQVDYVSEKTLKANNGVWVIDEEQKVSNYDQLSEDEKRSLDLQINDIILNNYTFINYNGVSAKTIKEKYVNTGYFDNKVIIIDEVHNFISGVSNKSKITSALYTLLMKSTNIKLILLSGTPIINTPNEIAYTINLLKGYEYIYSLHLKENNENVLINILNTIPEIDTYQIEIQNKVSKIHLSLVPNLFKKTNNKVSFNELNTLSDEEIIQKIIRTFEEKKIPFIQKFVTKHNVLPTELNEFGKYFVDEIDHTMMNKELFMRRIMGTVSHFVNNDPRLYPTMNIVAEDIFMSDYQYDKYVDARKQEKKLEKRQSTSLFGNQVSVYKTYSRNICNFVFPENIDRPKPKDIRNMKTNEKKEEYNKQIAKALSKLTNDNLKKDLHLYSPKFKRMIENINKSEGTVLVYSQFSSVEGIELLSRCLNQVKKSESNIEYGEFKIMYKNDMWDIDYDPKKTGYIKFKSDLNLTDDKKTQYNNIVLGIFNNEFDRLPANIRNKLGKTNLRGEILKILFITQSGAEGISLKNVRQVHITEPYWNKNRIDQVIGRANRTCSHIALPEKERNFTVYSYTMKMTPEQLKKKDNKMIVSVYDKNLTTDEFIYNIANNKHRIISQFLECMKKVSVDCTLNNPEMGCFTFPVDLQENNKAYTLDISKDTLDNYNKNATIDIKKKAIKITIKSLNKTFIYVQDTNELFDYTMYVTTSTLKLVGHMKEIDDKTFTITFV